jgi:hypothetical protein
MSKELALIEPWNYEKSVETTKALVSTYRKCSLDLVKELFSAREALSNQGFRTDLGTNVPKFADGQFCPTAKTWESYCEDIGLEKRTVNRWLALYVPEEERLLTTEEMKERIEERYLELKAELTAHIGDPDWRPEGWIKPFESRYQKELHDRKLDLIAQANSFDYVDEGGQFWLFDQPYLETLSERISSYNTDLVAYQKLCTTYQKDARKDVDIRKQVSIFQLTKAALEDISEIARPEVTRFVAELLIKDAAGTLKY